MKNYTKKDVIAFICSIILCLLTTNYIMLMPELVGEQETTTLACDSSDAYDAKVGNGANIDDVPNNTPSKILAVRILALDLMIIVVFAFTVFLTFIVIAFVDKLRHRPYRFGLPLPMYDAVSSLMVALGCLWFCMHTIVVNSNFGIALVIFPTPTADMLGAQLIPFSWLIFVPCGVILAWCFAILCFTISSSMTITVTTTD